MKYIIFVFMFIIVYLILKYLKKDFTFIGSYAPTISVYLIIIVFVVAIVTNPKQSFDSALNGISLCFNIVFPSLFPFFVATELLIRLKIVNILGCLLEPIIRPLFNVPGSGSFSFALGILSGYPVGAKTIADLRNKNLCTKTEGNRLLTFCNNSGPLFILSAVSIGIFNNPTAGIILYSSHFLAALTVGFLFRFYKYNERFTPYYINNKNFISVIKKNLNASKNNNIKNLGKILGDAIKNSIDILLMVSGFIIFFSVFINLLDVLNITTVFYKFTRTIIPYFGISEKLLSAMLKGFLEITTGIKNIGALETITLIEKLTITSIIIGWGGLSVHLQVISILGETDLSIKVYIIGKLLHGLISGMYTFTLLYLIKPDISVSYYFIDKLKDNIFYSPYMYAATSIFLLLGFIVLILITITLTIFLFYIKNILSSLIKQQKC